MTREGKKFYTQITRILLCTKNAENTEKNEEL